MPKSLFFLVALVMFAAFVIGGCGSAPTASTDAPAASMQESAQTTSGEAPLVIYSGRSESLVGDLITQFSNDTGIAAEVRYGDTAELAATILEEGTNSPADIFFAQDAGALGALEARSVFTTLSDETLGLVEERFHSAQGAWVGVSGRARVIVYNTEALSNDAVPTSVLDLTDPQWQGRVGWAPTNGSFQAFVTALRLEIGEDAARAWLEGMIANDVQVYEKNTPIVQAVIDGEIDLGLVNHYYLYQFRAEGSGENAENFFPPQGNPGALINVAGVGVLASSDQPAAAQQFVEYLLAEPAQRYFVEQTYEYPLTTGVEADPRLPALDSIQTPDIDLNRLEDLAGTLELLQDVGALR